MAILWADLFQLLYLSEDIAKFDKKQGDKSHELFTLQIGIFILFGYFLMSAMVFSVKDRNASFYILAHFIFTMQQIHLIIRNSPLTTKEGVTELMTASVIEMITFVCLVVGPLIPFR